MRRLLMILSLMFIATGAIAQDTVSHPMVSVRANMPRHDLSKMTCDEVKAALQSEGSAVFTWQSSKGMPRHAKYMSPDRSCKMQQMKAMTTIKASDGSCRVATCGQYGRSPTRM
jgi:hypothetical protein